MADLFAQMPTLTRTRLVDDVVSRVRTMIIDGTLPPGTTLLQIELSEKLGVSRTPLREAFRILEHEGFVRTANGNKTLEVVDLSDDDMVELYQFREVVDGLAARLSARKGIAEVDFDQLNKYIEEMHSMKPRNPRDAAARAGVHAAFHVGIAELSGNRLVVNQIPMIRLTSQMLARRISDLGFAEPDIAAGLLSEGEVDHRAVLDAIKNGGGSDAESIARRHIRRTMRSELIRR
jgi:GntR family transcriptional regulator, vanillate catabolism transcriptional regulator